MFKTTFYFAIFSSVYIAAHKDYYWRDYNETIPEDAIVGRRNVDGKSVYVGQVYISREGLVPVKIDPATTGVFAEIKGVQFARKHIKILCGPSGNFEWHSTTSSSLHVDLINKHPVVGGHEDGWGTYFVGRILPNQGTCIGKILEAGMNGSSYFYCVNEQLESEVANEFEVLVNINSKDKS